MGKIKDIFIKILNDNNGEYPVGYTLQQYLENEKRTAENDQTKKDGQGGDTRDDLLSKGQETNN